MKRLASANNEELVMIETSPSDKPAVKLGANRDPFPE
jgi:hypothetical protein